MGKRVNPHIKIRVSPGRVVTLQRVGFIGKSAFYSSPVTFTMPPKQLTTVDGKKQPSEDFKRVLQQLTEWIDSAKEEIRGKMVKVISPGTINQEPGLKGSTSEEGK